MNKEKLVILDGNAIVHRAYHAIPPLSNKKGEMVNAVYGFASMMLKVWKELDPKYLAVTFDLPGKTFRHEKFVEYKATRKKADPELYDQIPMCHELVEAFNIPIFEKSGFEADDLIGTISKKMSLQCHSEEPKNLLKKGEGSFTSVQDDSGECVETYIVTGDKDTIQLVDKNTFVYTLGRGMGDIIIYDEKKVSEKFGFTPIQMIDFKAFAGDPSDNIPGIKGIGAKTATKLIQEYGGIKEIYQGLDKLEEKGFKKGQIQKITEGQDSAEMSYDLATIDCDVKGLDFKLKDTTLKEFNKQDVLDLFQEYEFVSLLKRVPGMENEAQKFNPKTKKELKKKTEFKFTELKTKEDVEKLFKKIEKKGEFACKALTTGADVFTSKLTGLVFVVDGESFYVPSSFVIPTGVEGSLNKIFSDKKIKLIGHDLKKLIKVLSVCHSELDSESFLKNDSTKKDPDFHQDDKRGIEVKNQIFDTMLASYLLNPGSRAHKIDAVVFKVLGIELPEDNGQNSLFGADPKKEAQELVYIYQIKEILAKELKENEDLGLLEKVEGPLVKVLATMELNGVAIDSGMLDKMHKDVEGQIKKLTKKIHDLAGEEFNIASPTQLREILFEKLEIPIKGIKKGKTGLSTGASELEKLWGMHPIIEKISEFRELSKLQNTYISVLPGLVNKKTGRIHTTYNQAVTATGRLSSSDPNLQNIPVKTPLGREIKKAFVAEKGNELVVADYSQIELRIVASLSKDKNMIEIFNKGEDIHRATAAIVNGVKLNDVTDDMRRAAKAVNFGVLYGMGVYGLSQGAKISVVEAKDFITKYFEKFSDVRKYLDKTLEFAKEEGYVETLFGRRRYLPELHASNFQVRNAAERMAINHPVQGTAADLMKMAMIEVQEKLDSTFCHPEQSEGSSGCPVRMLLQVHDEIVLEVKKDLADKVAGLVKETMEGVVKMNVPVEVDVNIGKRWGDIH